MLLTRPIETSRLIIRPFVPDDWPGVYAYASDPRVMHFIPGGPLTEAQARVFVDANAEAYGVELRHADSLIGHIVFHPWHGFRTYEIGWVFHPDHHGRGHATEAAEGVLRYCFEELDAHRVIATCQPENPASFRVMGKLGMRREAHFRRCLHRGGDEWWDEYFYALLRDEWFARTHRT